MCSLNLQNIVIYTVYEYLYMKCWLISALWMRSNTGLKRTAFLCWWSAVMAAASRGLNLCSQNEAASIHWLVRLAWTALVPFSYQEVEFVLPHLPIGLSTHNANRKRRSPIIWVYVILLQIIFTEVCLHITYSKPWLCFTETVLKFLSRRKSWCYLSEQLPKKSIDIFPRVLIWRHRRLLEELLTLVGGERAPFRPGH